MSKTDNKGAIAWMAGNSVASNLLMLVFIIGGIIFATQIKQEVFPEFEVDIVSISVAYPGASPEEVEQGITLAVEENVRGLDGVKEVTSSSNEGSSSVMVELLEGVDTKKLTQDIKNAVDRITSFPKESEQPHVELVSTKRRVLSLIIYGMTNEKTLRELAEQIRDELLQDEDITQVDIAAAKDMEISIEIPQKQLRAYNLTLAQVANKISQAAIELPGGSVKTSDGEVLLRVTERKDLGDEFRTLPVITGNDGTIVRLEDIAKIKDEFAEEDREFLFNGKPAIRLRIYRVGNQTPIEVSNAVKKHVEQLNQTLPDGIKTVVWSDRSDIFRQRIDLLLKNAYLGLALVFIMLALFLETRLAFWVSMGIPTSFLGSMLFLPVVGVSINMVSLFAFIIALGIVVDDTIVVGENIYNWHQKGLSFGQAAIKGTREVVMPVTFSVLTNIAAFAPLFFVPGVMGKVFKMIPFVVVLVFSISLVECLFVLPAHLAHQKEKTGGLLNWIHHYQQRFSNWFTHLIKDYYGTFIDRAVARRYTVISISIAVLVMTIAYIASGRMGFSMFPRVESDTAIATAKLPYGAPVEQTRKIQKILLDTLDEVVAENGGDKLCKGIYSQIGYSMMGDSGSHVTSANILLTEPEIRPMGSGDLIKLWRKKIGRIPGFDTLQFKSDFGGPRAGDPIAIELSHRNIAVLEKASAELALMLKEFPTVKDVDDGFTPGKDQFDFRITDKGRALGLTAMEVARQVRTSFYGAEAIRQQRGRNELKIMVRLPKSERVSEYNIEELLIRSSDGVEIPLREAVVFKRGKAYTSIARREGRRIVTVTADCDPPSMAGQILNALNQKQLPALKQKYAGLTYSFEGEQKDMRESMQSLLLGFLMAMFVIYALLAIPFKSYTQPAIIMVSIPFGIVGAALGHILMGYSLSIISMMGVVALSGVVVNDSLVLIEYANRQRQGGHNAHDSVCAAGIRRFRPIILTSCTTFGGLAPMIFETSLQAKFLIPMAISLGYGIMFATLIALILVPCLYMAIEDFRHFMGLDVPKHLRPQTEEAVKDAL